MKGTVFVARSEALVSAVGLGDSSGEAAKRATPLGVGARYFNAYRLSAYVLLFYAVGHTLGAVAATPGFGAESDAVVSAMKTVHVAADGADCTWYGFYRGFGILVSVFFAFSAFLTWHLGGKNERERRAFLPVTWTLFLSYAASIPVTWVYFFAAPRFLSTVVAVLLGFACVRETRARAVASTAT